MKAGWDAGRAAMGRTATGPTGGRWVETIGGRVTPAVVIAIDEESYRSALFRDSPTLTWTGEIGRVLTAVVVLFGLAVLGGGIASAVIGERDFEEHEGEEHSGSTEEEGSLAPLPVVAEAPSALVGEPEPPVPLVPLLPADELAPPSSPHAMAWKQCASDWPPSNRCARASR